MEESEKKDAGIHAKLYIHAHVHVHVCPCIHTVKHTKTHRNLLHIIFILSRTALLHNHDIKYIYQDITAYPEHTTISSTHCSTIVQHIPAIHSNTDGHIIVLHKRFRGWPGKEI